MQAFTCIMLRTIIVTVHTIVCILDIVCVTSISTCGQPTSSNENIRYGPCQHIPNNLPQFLKKIAFVTHPYFIKLDETETTHSHLEDVQYEQRLYVRKQVPSAMRDLQFLDMKLSDFARDSNSTPLIGNCASDRVNSPPQHFFAVDDKYNYCPSLSSTTREYVNENCTTVTGLKRFHDNYRWSPCDTPYPNEYRTDAFRYLIPQNSESLYCYDVLYFKKAPQLTEENRIQYSKDPTWHTNRNPYLLTNETRKRCDDDSFQLNTPFYSNMETYEMIDCESI